MKRFMAENAFLIGYLVFGALLLFALTMSTPTVAEREARRAREVTPDTVVVYVYSPDCIEMGKLK